MSKLKFWERVDTIATGVQLFTAGMALGLSLCFFLNHGKAEAHTGRLMTEAAWGVSAAQSKFEDRPCVPGMTLAVGQLAAADHEQDEGYWSVGPHVALVVKPDSLNNRTTLPNYRGDEVVLSIRLRKAEE